MTTFQEYLNSLWDSLGREKQAPKSAALLRLSGLSAQETAEFAGRWVTLPAALRRGIVTKLVELSEDSVELDFSSLFRSCLEDKDPQVREQAVRGLWECEERALIRPLARLLADDPSAHVRTAAAMALSS